VTYHSLPVGLRAVVHSGLSDKVRATLDYCRITDAARLLGMPAMTVRYWVSSGRIPTIQHLGKPLIRLSEVRALRANPPTRGRPLKVQPAE